MATSGRVGWRYLVTSAAGHHLASVRARADVLRAPALATTSAGRLPGATVTTTHPGAAVHLVVPPGLDRADARALRRRDVDSLPAQFVLEAAGLTVLGRDGWLLHEGRLVADVWQEAGYRSAAAVPRGWLEDPVPLPGTTVSLLMPWLPNYYHWTVQAVPRALAVRDVLGDRFGDVDRWLIPGTAPGYVREWLDLLGVPRAARFEVASRRRPLRPERLVVASVPGRNRWVPRWAVEGLRAATGVPPEPRSGGGGRRLFITRAAGDPRVLLNEDEVLGVLAGRGFEVVDPSSLPLREEVDLFAAADVVVGVHGAGLTNLVHCRPGTDVVEIAPRGLVFPTFVKLAGAAGVRHHLVPGREPRLPARLGFPDMRADVVADVDRLAAVLDGLPVTAGRPTG